MVGPESVQKDFVNNSKLENQVDCGRKPINVEIDRVAAPPIDPEVDREDYDLGNRKVKEDRKRLMQLPPVHGADNDNLQDWLRNPESELDLGAGHRSHPGLRGLQAQ